MYERPLPLNPDGSVAVFELVFASGPLKGKRLGDCTKRDIESMKFWAER